MKKVLILSGLKILPNQSGGHLRSGSVAKSLARLGHEVCIYSLAGRKSDYGQGQPFLYQAIEENLVEEVNLSLLIGAIQSVSRRLGLPRFWQFLLLSLGLVPLSLRRRLQWADVIICDLPYTPSIRGIYRRKTWLLLSHNLEHRLLAQGSRTEKAFAGLMEKIEMIAPARYDGILACAKEDYEYFKDRAPDAEQIRLVANGIDPELYMRSEEEGQKIRLDYGLGSDDRLIVFSGSRFQPNLEALAELELFAKREKEFLRTHKIRFLILGSISSSPKVTDTMLFTGPVVSTHPYFAAADAALNPVRTGSGSNVKIFEYLAAQLPVISTSFGTRGTALLAQRDYLAFENVEDLKKCLLQLVEGKSKADWKEHAKDVWERVKDGCDMSSILGREWRRLKLKNASSAATPSRSYANIFSGTRSR